MSASVAERVAEVRRLLDAAEIHVVNEEVAANGARLNLHNDAIVNVYRTGTVQVQGKAQDVTKRALAELLRTPPSAPPTAPAPPTTPSLAARELPLAAGWTRCGACGGVLVDSWQFCPACGTAPDVGDLQRRCTHCDLRLADAWSYCPECATPADPNG